MSESITPSDAEITHLLTINPNLLDDLKAELSERHLADFIETAWPIINPSIEYQPSWHIDAMCEHVEAVFNGQIRKLLINVAPRSTKSFVCAVGFPAWGWLHNPSFKWLFTSYAENFAMRDSVYCRRLIESIWYRHYWGHIYHLAYDQNQKSQYQTNKMGDRTSVGMLGSGTGRGADIVVGDDPNSILDANSDAALQATNDAWFQVWAQRVNNPKTARFIVIQQRISAKDLSAQLIREGDWDMLILPNEYDPRRMVMTSLGWHDPRKQAGELLNPSRYGPTETAEKKKYPRIYQAQFQQNPAADEGAIFPRNKWRFYREDPKELVQHMETVIISMDAAFKDEENSSLVAIQVWGKRGANKFLLDRRTEHMDFNRSIDQLRALCNLWPQARAKVIEAKANGPAIINYLKKEIPGLIPWPPEGEKMDSKVARAWAIQPEHEAGNLYLPDAQTIPWVNEFIETCAAFPEGEYDDDIDCFTQAIAKLDRTPGSAPPLGVGHSRPWL